MQPTPQAVAVPGLEKIFADLIQILEAVAPLKTQGDLALETSLMTDLNFDSVDIMGMFVRVNETFPLAVSGINLDEWINECKRMDNGKPFTIHNVCRFITDHL